MQPHLTHSKMSSSLSSLSSGELIMCLSAVPVPRPAADSFLWNGLLPYKPEKPRLKQIAIVEATLTAPNVASLCGNRAPCKARTRPAGTP